jgi:hypothetical protein
VLPTLFLLPFKIGKAVGDRRSSFAFLQEYAQGRGNQLAGEMKNPTGLEPDRIVPLVDYRGAIVR